MTYMEGHGSGIFTWVKQNRCSASHSGGIEVVLYTNFGLMKRLPGP